MNNVVSDNNQNTINTTPPFDPNTTQQPEQNLVDDLAGMPDAPVSNAPVEEFPAQQESMPMDNSFMQPQPTVDVSNPPIDTQVMPSQPMMDTPVPPIDGGIQPQPMVDTQMNSMVQPESVVDTPIVSSDITQNQMPPFATPAEPMNAMPPIDMSAPLAQSFSQADPMNSVMPQSDPMVQPTEVPMPQFEATNTIPETLPSMDPQTPMPPIDTLPTMSAEPVVPPVASMEGVTSAQSAFPSQDLSEPMPSFSTPSESPMPAFNESEIVNTLGDSKDEGKGGTVVVIILIVVIIALLATIGYFAYKIFLS